MCTTFPNITRQHRMRPSTSDVISYVGKMIPFTGNALIIGHTTNNETMPASPPHMASLANDDGNDGCPSSSRERRPSHAQVERP